MVIMCASMDFIMNILENFTTSLVLFGIVHVIKDPEFMAEYEKEFIEAHKHKWDQCIYSEFDTENLALLMNLCQTYISQRKLIADPPKAEWHHINFKKMTHHPFFVEVIRCSPNYAIIRAPDHQCAYLLKKGKPNPDIGDVMFYFEKKFCYYFRDLTFQGHKYLKNMGRLPSTETELNVENRTDEGFPYCPACGSQLVLDNEYVDGIALSALFDEGEESLNGGNSQIDVTSQAGVEPANTVSKVNIEPGGSQARAHQTEARITETVVQSTLQTDLEHTMPNVDKSVQPSRAGVGNADQIDVKFTHTDAKSTKSDIEYK